MAFWKLSDQQVADIESIIPRAESAAKLAAAKRKQARSRWHKMMRRCYNERDQAFKNYGGRGIKVCAAWHDFDSYFADTGSPPKPTHTLDRSDNDGDYCPSNVRWATKAEQGLNRRCGASPTPSVLKIGKRYRAQVRVQVARTFDTEEAARRWGDAFAALIAAESAN